MSKLFKLREWLTVADTAKHLSNILEEEVTEADVLLLALERRLKLSVNFVNNSHVKFGRIVGWEDTEWFSMRNYKFFKFDGQIKKKDGLGIFAPKLKELIDNIQEGKGGASFFESQVVDAIIRGESERIRSIIDFAADKKYSLNWGPMIQILQELYCPKLQVLIDGISEEESSKWVFGMRSINLDDKRYLNFEDEVKLIEGIWDLSMMGSEIVDIKRRYQDLTGGPVITINNFNGCLLEKPCGQICQLQKQDKFFPNEYKYGQTGSTVHLAELKIKIQKEELRKIEARKLLNQYQKDRKEFLNKTTFYEIKSDYYPASRLPHDSVLVVRTAALREFEQLLENADDKNIKSVKESTRKTENLLRTLATIAIDQYGYDPKSAKSPIPQEIVDVLSGYEINFDSKTIRSWLKEGAALLPSNPRKC